MKKFFISFTITLFFVTNIYAKFSEIPKKIVFGVLEVGDKDEMTRRFKNIASHIKKSVGVDIKIYIARDAKSLIRGLKFGRINIAYLGPSTALKAMKKSNSKLLVIENSKSNGFFTYGYLITNSNSKINSFKEIRSLAILHKMSIAYEDFKHHTAKLNLKYKLEETKSFVISMDKLKNDIVDTVIVSSTMLDRHIIRKKRNRGDLKILWKTKKMPGFSIVASKKLPITMINSIKKALINYNDKTILDLMNLKGFSHIEEKKFINYFFIHRK